jgi:PAS domain-containing protein
MNSEEKIRLLFASIADGLLITDMAGRITIAITIP